MELQSGVKITNVWFQGTIHVYTSSQGVKFLSGHLDFEFLLPKASTGNYAAETCSKMYKIYPQKLIFESFNFALNPFISARM